MQIFLEKRQLKKKKKKQTENYNCLDKQILLRKINREKVFAGLFSGGFGEGFVVFSFWVVGVFFRSIVSGEY